jgi:glycosyltransferase involved in cell wall biosynthesis
MTGGQVSSAPLVSVGIPVFNGEATIRETLESVLNQTYKNLEVLVYNNGSTDGTEAVVLDIARRDARVTCRSGDANQGVSRSFNEAFRMSTGSYFMWVAADDQLDALFVESGVALLEADPRIGVSVPIVTAHLEGHEGPVYSVRFEGFEPNQSALRILVRSIRKLPGTCIYGLFRSEVLGRSGLFAPVYMTDVALLQEIALRAPIVCNTDQCLRYNMQARWKTTAEEMAMFSPGKFPRRSVPPALLLLRERIRRLRDVAPTRRHWIIYSVVVICAETWRIGWRALWLLTRKLVGRRPLRSLATAWYWRHMLPDYMTVIDRVTYERRIVLPTLGLE